MSRYTLYLLLISIWFGSLPVQGQDESPIAKDLNGDGITDTISYFYEGGSNFGGRDLKAVNGKSGDQLNISTFGCFCSIKNTIPIPEEYLTAKNLPFFNALRDEYLSPMRSAPDPSLDWILKSTFSNHPLKNHTYFDNVLLPKVSWSKEELEMPSVYAMTISGDTLRQIPPTEDQLRSLDGKSYSKGYLIYYGHNHYRLYDGDSLHLVNESRKYHIYRTSHGLLAEKGAMKKWIFVTDIDLMEAPGKLRWESIGQTELIDQYVILEHLIPPAMAHQVFIINIETGAVGKLKDYYSSLNENGPVRSTIFKIENGKISLNREEELIIYPVKDLFSALDKLTDQ